MFRARFRGISGTGRAYARTRILLLIQDLRIRIINAATGELLRELSLDPGRNYQPTGRPPGPTKGTPRKRGAMHPARFRHHAVTRPARLLAGVAGGVAVALSLGAAAVPAAAHSARTDAINSLVAQPVGVSVQSAGNAWAVSQGPAPAYDAILHWNGTQWTKMTYPGLANSDLLWAVTALSASDAWAVGNVTDHWDGAHWSQVAAPIPVGPNGPQNLCAVDGTPPRTCGRPAAS